MEKSWFRITQEKDFQVLSAVDQKNKFEAYLGSEYGLSQLNEGVWRFEGRIMDQKDYLIDVQSFISTITALKREMSIYEICILLSNESLLIVFKGKQYPVGVVTSLSADKIIEVLKMLDVHNISLSSDKSCYLLSLKL
jgi:hypothetical protein